MLFKYLNNLKHKFRKAFLTDFLNKSNLKYLISTCF